MVSSVIQLGDSVLYQVLVRLVFSATYNVNTSTCHLQTLCTDYNRHTAIPYPFFFLKDNKNTYYSNVKTNSCTVKSISCQISKLHLIK